MNNVLPVNKTLLLFTDKYGRLLDTHNLDCAYCNILNEIPILENTAVIFDEYSQYLIGDQYIFGYNRLPIYVSDNYDYNLDWAVNLKSKDALDSYIREHDVNFVYLHLTPHITKYGFDKSDVIIEVRCEFLDGSKGEPTIKDLFAHRECSKDSINSGRGTYSLYHWYSVDLIKSLIDDINITVDKYQQARILGDIVHTIPVSVPKLPWYFPDEGYTDPNLQFEAMPLVKNRCHGQSNIKKGIVTEITIFDKSLW